MDKQSIMLEIEVCKEEGGLTNNQRKSRLKIFQAALEKIKYDEKYNCLIEEYKEKGALLEKLTNGKICLDTYLVITESRLLDYIKESEIAKYLKIKNIKCTSFDELLAHANIFKSEINNNFDVTILEQIKQLYEIIQKIRLVEKEEIKKIADLLEYIFGEKIIALYDYVLVNEEENKTKLEKRERSVPELNKYYTEAIKKLEKKNEFLGEQAVNLTLVMLKQIFSYYCDGNKEIDLKDKSTKKI